MSVQLLGNLNKVMNGLLRRVQELNKELIIREANLTDSLGFTSLMNQHYPRKNNEKYLLWRFFSCPKPSILYVITTKENVVIGAYGLNIFTLTNGKRCGLTVDLIISDKYRNRGLLFLLENKIKAFAKKNNCAYLLCIPNALGMKAHTKIEGWQIVGTIPKLVLKSKKINLLKDYSTVNILDKKNISFEYTKTLLHWRFNENPEYKYLHVKLGRSQSYIKIFYDTTKKMPVGDIVYYTPSPYSKSELSKLIDMSVQKLLSMNAQEIITWCSKNSSLFDVFIALGFVSENQPRYLCVKPLSLSEMDPALLDWQILPADSEVF